MEKTTRTDRNIDKYIDSFTPDVQRILQKIRTIIKKCAPDAEETISYGIPTFKLSENLVHFAAYKKHIGFYPTSSGILAFKKDLSVYKHARGSVQFPLNSPIPYELIKSIVKYRVTEIKEKNL